MAKSMTGYGSGVFQNETYKITVEIRTLNSRYLEVHVHPPKELPGVEPEIKKRIKDAIKRGRVDVDCSIETTKAEIFEINAHVVAKYIDLFTKIKSEFGLSGDLTVSGVAQLPGVITIKPSNMAVGEESFRKHLDSALAAAIESVNRMRSEEGNALKKDILYRLDLIGSYLSSIDAESGTLLKYYQSKLLQRLRDLTENLQLDESRLLQEAVFYAERSDITEEITRLKSHIAQFRRLMEEGEEIGKKLDFLLQEMNREVTTILSKAGSAGTAESAVNLRAEIEKIREQVQNVE